MNILVVDDEPIVLESCRRIFEDQGYSVQLVSSADEALAAMHTDPFDLLLADIKMPARDGLDLIGEIRGRWPKTSIIVMTGYATSGTIQKSYRAGSDRCISKPFTPDELLDALREVIRKGSEDETI